MKRYWEDFSNYSDLWANFGGYSSKGLPPPDYPTDDEILFACYTPGDYCGDAFVLFKKDGNLYEVSGSHCSCYGLEDQWQPEETSWEALRMRKSFLYNMSDDALAELKEIIGGAYEQ